MSALRPYVIVALLLAIVTHFALVQEAPRFLMSTAFDRLSGNGAQVNAWRQSPRVTEASRTIVRPSPDLNYAACPYDLANGPIAIRVTAWPQYWSLSLYAANSDNYFVLDDREAHDGAEIVLVRTGHIAPEQATARSARVVESPTQRGIALVRRLAPSAADFEAASAVARNDACAPLR